MENVFKKLKAYMFVLAGILGLCAIIFITTNSADASVAAPESLLAPEYDVWCEGPPRNCEEVIITPESE